MRRLYETNTPTPTKVIWLASTPQLSAECLCLDGKGQTIIFAQRSTTRVSGKKTPPSITAVTRSGRQRWRIAAPEARLVRYLRFNPDDRLALMTVYRQKGKPFTLIVDASGGAPVAAVELADARLSVDNAEIAGYRVSRRYTPHWVAPPRVGASPGGISEVELLRIHTAGLALQRFINSAPNAKK